MKSREQEAHNNNLIMAGMSPSINAGVHAFNKASGPINDKTNIHMKALRPRTFDA